MKHYVYLTHLSHKEVVRVMAGEQSAGLWHQSLYHTRLGLDNKSTLVKVREILRLWLNVTMSGYVIAGLAMFSESFTETSLFVFSVNLISRDGDDPSWQWAIGRVHPEQAASSSQGTSFLRDRAALNMQVRGGLWAHPAEYEWMKTASNEVKDGG